MPCDRVANAVVKNGNRLRSRAASTPCPSSASISASSSVKLLVMPMRRVVMDAEAGGRYSPPWTKNRRSEAPVAASSWVG